MHQSSSNPCSDVASSRFYTWKGYRCAYEHYSPTIPSGTPLLLIHPIGVGLSRKFWQRFCDAWYRTDQHNPIYNPDLLGCGESAMPHVAYDSIDWAEQLQEFLKTVVQVPVIIVIQGASLPIALELVKLQPDLIRGFIFAGPPSWPLITKTTAAWGHRLAWNLFDSPAGTAFYRYARRSQFLRRFSARQLFASEAAVDANWINTLQAGAQDLASRHAVFSFLAGFWRQDYGPVMADIQQPTLVVMGETATSISREGEQITPGDRLANYLKCLPNSQGLQISGRNVLPYESTAEFVRVSAAFVQTLETARTQS